jgi:IstB-like ATP binding protein
LKFIDEREDALFIGSPGVGKSHIAKALALLAVQRGYTAFYREAHVLIDDINQARELGELRKYRATLSVARQSGWQARQSGWQILEGTVFEGFGPELTR